MDIRTNPAAPAGYRYLWSRDSSEGEKEAIIVQTRRSLPQRNVMIFHGHKDGFRVIATHDYGPGAKSGAKVVLASGKVFRFDHVSSDAKRTDAPALVACFAVLRAALHPTEGGFHALIAPLFPKWKKFAAEMLRALEKAASSGEYPEPYRGALERVFFITRR
jgi:hypothetical protein